MLGSNLEEAKNQNQNNVKVTKTIKKVLNNDSENPEVLEETVYYDKDELEKFENFENQDFGFGENASNITKNVSVEEDENGTITKVVNIEYSVEEDDTNNEGDIIIETSIINDGTYDSSEKINVEEKTDRSFIDQVKSVFTGKSKTSEKEEENKQKAYTTRVYSKDLYSYDDLEYTQPTEEIIEVQQQQPVETVTEIIKESSGKPEVENVSEDQSKKEDAKDETTTTTEVVIDPETGKKKTITKKFTRKVITKNASGELLPEDNISTTRELVVDPITGKKKYVTKKITRKLVAKTGTKEDASKEPSVVVKELPGGIIEKTELVVDPVTGKKKYVTKRIIKKLVTPTVTESSTKSEEIVEQSDVSGTEVKEQIIEVPSEIPGKKKYIKRIIRYIKRINPTTGEEVIEEQPVEEVVTESREGIVPEAKEEIIEVPSEEPSKKKYIKRIIRYIKRVNPTTGKEEIVEEQPVEEVITEEEQKKPGFLDKLANKIEEIVVGEEKPVEEEIITTTEVIPEKQVVEEVSVEPKEEIIPEEPVVEEVSVEPKEEPVANLANVSIKEGEPEKKNVLYRVFGKNKRRSRKSKNGEPVEGDETEESIIIEEEPTIEEVSTESKEEIVPEEPVVEEISTEPREEVVPEEPVVELANVSEPTTEVKEQIIEVPSEEPGRRKFIKRIIRYITRKNPETGEEEVVEEQPVEEVVAEPREGIVPEAKEEIIEVPSEEPGKKKYIKRIIRYIKRVNPTTGEEEIVEEEPREEIITEEEQKKPGFLDRLANKIEEIVASDEKPAEEPVEEEQKEEIVQEVPVVEEEVSTEPREEVVPEEPVTEVANVSTKKKNQKRRMFYTESLEETSVELRRIRMEKLLKKKLKKLNQLKKFQVNQEKKKLFQKNQ